MALLSSADRAAVSADYQRDISQVREPCKPTKTALRLVVNAIDDWVDANQASAVTAINAALVAGGFVAGDLTAQQKVDMFLRVVRRRVKGN